MRDRPSFGVAMGPGASSVRHGAGDAEISSAKDSQGTITELLTKWQRGHDTALAAAVSAVYQDLRRIASRRLLYEHRTPTLDTTTLVHEAYLRLARQDRTAWKNRGHFLAVAARIMRRILVDRARAKRYAKRGAVLTTLDGEAILPGRPLDVLALHDALTDLARFDEGLAALVEMRFFGGLTNAEIGESLGVTPLTIIRRWRLARAWLQRYLTTRETGADSSG